MTCCEALRSDAIYASIVFLIAQDPGPLAATRGQVTPHTEFRCADVIYVTISVKPTYLQYIYIWKKDWEH